MVVKTLTENVTDANLLARVTSYETIWLAARRAPIKLNLLSLDQPAMAAAMIPCPDMAKT